MLKLNGTAIEVRNFPDGTLLLKEDVSCLKEEPTITWLFENNEELLGVYFLTRHLQSKGIEQIHLNMPYIPNARMDRVKSPEDVFTLKYFAEMINAMKFKSVTVLDPHSSVSEALIDNVVIRHPDKYVWKVIEKVEKEDSVLMFYPDEGAMKRYSGMVDRPYAFGIKKRDWKTGQIQGLDVSGMVEQIKNSKVVIVDDICSRGGTFYHSAKKLKELGAKEIYLYISHCENTILEGEVLSSGLIDKVYTTNSIFTKAHERIEVFDYE